MARLQVDTSLRDPGYGKRSGNRNVALESMGVSGVVDVGHESHTFARIGLLGFGFVLFVANLVRAPEIFCGEEWFAMLNAITTIPECWIDTGRHSQNHTIHTKHGTRRSQAVSTIAVLGDRSRPT